MRFSRVIAAFFATVVLLSLVSIIFNPSAFAAALYLAGFSLLIATILFAPKRDYNAY